MSDDKLDRIIQVLEEIKIQQKEHYDHYRSAVENQAESIKLQKEAIRSARQSRRTIPVVLVLIVVVVWVIGELLASLH